MLLVLAGAGLLVYHGAFAGSSKSPSGNQFLPASSGNKAPNGYFVLANGTNSSVAASYSKGPVIFWFVTTWCSGCAQGTQVLANNMSFFASRNVKVIEVELYKDLGGNGQPITSFINTYAQNRTGASLIEPALSGQQLSYEYDPKGYLDIYYLILPNGTISYVNANLALTMQQLKGAVASS